MCVCVCVHQTSVESTYSTGIAGMTGMTGMTTFGDTWKISVHTFSLTQVITRAISPHTP